MVDRLEPDLAPEAYLAWEPIQAIRYEYIDGKVIAKPPQTIAQVTILNNLVTALQTRMHGNPCQLMLGMKVQVQQSFYYPDLIVSCDEHERGATQVIQHPCLIVEVRSAENGDTPETLSDRNQRFAAYQQLDALQEYALIDSRWVAIECWRRGKADWMMHRFGAENSVYLDTVSFLCPTPVLYQGTPLQ